MPDFFPRTAYSFHEEEFIAGLPYHAPAVDYEKLWYGETVKIPAEYAAEMEVDAGEYASPESGLLTAPEAEKVFLRMQYAALAGNGNMYQINGEERRRFDLWIKFNPALFKLFESLQALTADVNYSAM